MDQIGAVAGRQYQGEGLSVAATPEGARLRCVFQKLEGQATPEGLWLASTADGAKGERFRVVASVVGRTSDYGLRRQAGRDAALDGCPVAAAKAVCALTPHPPQSKTLSDSGAGGRAPQLLEFERPLPRAGKVEVADQVVRFIRPGLTEEYSVSMDGVRQDFLVRERPEGAGQLRVELEVTGAKAESLVNGARLLPDRSGRSIAYSRLRATDATGKELRARIEVASVADEVTRLKSNAERKQNTEMSQSLLTSAVTGARLAVVVDDGDAVYPVRIDPTFNDDNWISMGGVPGANGRVYAAAVDGTGNLYIGGDFTVVGEVMANYVAKWDGSSWSPLGSGLNYSVQALAVSGANLYAGGEFTTAGGKVSAYVARAIIGPRFTNPAYSPTAEFSCTFSEATPGEAYRIQASPVLPAGSWTDLTNFTYTGPITITDSSTPGPTNRFYRAVWGP